MFAVATSGPAQAHRQAGPVSDTAKLYAPHAIHAIAQLIPQPKSTKRPDRPDDQIDQTDPINAPVARTIWDLLTSAERRSAVVLLGLMLIGMVLETLGADLMIPAIALFTPPLVWPNVVAPVGYAAADPKPVWEATWTKECGHVQRS